MSLSRLLKLHTLAHPCRSLTAQRDPSRRSDFGSRRTVRGVAKILAQACLRVPMLPFCAHTTHPLGRRRRQVCKQI